MSFEKELRLAYWTNKSKRLRIGMVFLSMTRFGQQLKIVDRIIGLVFVFMMNFFSEGKKTTKRIFHQHSMKRIKPIAIRSWMERLCAGISIATTIANRCDLKE